ncbi:hypothetical protein FE257_002227 [Aspergillus nanangensis]|uniref:Rhodopsin domain-containing protein n=1 Tax=Aspergillus nanangensis TaxID=2582783 RepID=A0AAD4CCX4_ASPNN|nr:hypothetical protein FE257_002227 [Aspergillus nanangensis]
MEPISSTGSHPLQRWDIITQSVCLTISTCCVGIRMCTKLLITKSPGWEDWLIAYAVITFEADKYGSGAHQWEVHAADLREFSKVANVSQIVYGPIIFITKLSILLLYIRLFAPSIKSKTYLFIQLLIWVNLLFYLSNTIVKIVQCTPRSKIWDKDTPGHCVNINSLILGASIFNVVSDFLILLMPIACVWRLQMNSGKKIGTSAVFAAGAFLMRLVVSLQNKSLDDKTHEWFGEFLWTTAEITAGIVASCLPAFPTLFRRFFQKTKTVLSELSSGISRNSMVKGLNAPNRPLRPIRHPGRNLSDTELIPYSPWDRPQSERGPGDVFQGTCFITAKAKVGRGLEPTMDAEASGGPSGLSQGILKIVEVDVESGPGDSEKI